MASKEEIQKQNIGESNKLLAEQINLVTSIQDKMSALIKSYREKGNLDKASLNIINQTIKQTRSLSSEYDSLKNVQKDIAKNTKNQNDLQKQMLALQQKGGKELKEELELYKTKQGSLTKAQNKLAQIESDKKLGRKVDEALYKQAAATVQKKEEQLKIAKEALTPEAAQVVLLEETNEAQKKAAEHLAEQLRQQENLAKSQSLFVSMLEGANNLLNKMGMGNLAKGLGLDAAVKKAKDLTYELTDGGKKSLSVFGKLRVGVAAFGAGLKAALGPMTIILGLINMIKNAYEKGKEAALRINNENTDMARTLGISQKSAESLAKDVRGIGAAMGITGGAATQSATQIYSALDGAEKLSNNTLKTFMKLNVFAGMTGESLASVQKLSKLTGENAGQVASNMALTAQESIKNEKVNVSMKQVMEGVGKISNTLKLTFKGSAEQLTNAFIQSKKLGLELSKVEEVANSLLNIEDSIAAEMEAELLTGKELNLEKAREAALNNDTAALMTEIANQFGSIEDYQKMNRIQQEAFAKSIGMSRDGLADMLVASKENAAANTDMVSEQDKGLAAMQSMAKISETLAAREEARANQFAGIFTALMPIVEAFKDLGPLVVKIITPIVQTLVPILKDIMVTLMPTITSIFKDLGTIVAALMEAFKPIFILIVDIAKQFLPIIQDLFKQLTPIIIEIINSFKPIIPIIVDLVKMLLPVMVEIFKMVAPFLGIILNIFAEIAKILVPLLVKTLQYIMPIIKPILDIFVDILKVITSILKGDWDAVGAGLKKIGVGILNLVTSLIQGTINLLIKGVNAILDAIPGIGANLIPSVSLPKIALAEGGIVTQPTNALIGEKGPEAVIPLSKSNKNTPNIFNTIALEKKLDILINTMERGMNISIDGNKVNGALALSNYQQQ